MNNRKTFVMTFFIPLVFGVIVFFQLTQRPRFSAIQTVDVFQLLASGLCFGVALGALLTFLRGPRSS